MKVTRSYWLGLGSGLILSAMLTLAFSQQGQVLLPQGQELSAGQGVNNPETTPSQSEETQQSDPSPFVQTPDEPQPQNLPSEIQTSSQVEREFVIPKGASAEKIAKLLLSQDFINDEAAFLELVHQMKVERQFRAGTFSLSLGLNEEALIGQLLK